MEFTSVEINAMRKELMNHAFSALVRRMPMNKCKAYEYIANYLGVKYSTVTNMVQKGISAKHASGLSDIAARFKTRMYHYQFAPTDAICQAWLEHDYRCDKGKHPSKHLFKHWDRDMNKLHIYEEV
ncbi:hypothetical protein [Vibrio rhizosphaerae]|uniref:Uncharacterized protein n=1 Tax=Vibrio rhizosphaerae TaxID=398736 RepID=A0ABU4IXT4_9VIBR|nr:hypothetical protein [Vibrio rhizosphaerae]MDW6094220.1 hypothetical protein [Vibrio rhizosphaerae]